MTDADFLSITLNGKLCDGEGGLGLQEFERVMREQVCLPTARKSDGLVRLGQSTPLWSCHDGTREWICWK